ILSLLCSQTPIGTLFPYTTLFRSADVAQALRENQVGARGAERGLVDLIQGAAGTDPFSNHAARVTARLAVILQKGMAYDWFLPRSEEHTSELQSRSDLVCRLLLEK